MRARARGFTLLEMMTVVAIIGVMSAVSVPFIVRMIRNSAVSGSVRQLETELSSARAQAVLRGFPFVVCVRSNATPIDPRTYIVFRKANPLLAPAVVTEGFAGFEPADQVVFRGRLEPGVEWVGLPVAANQSMQIVFDMNGVPTAWGSDTCDSASPRSRVLAGANVTFGVRHTSYTGLDELQSRLTVRPAGAVVLVP
jgi:prepilin-type N-terminal cleavage/methylation domain-containing protein